MAKVLEAKDEGELLIKRLEKELAVLRASSLSPKKISKHDVTNLYIPNSHHSKRNERLKSKSEKNLSETETMSLFTETEKARKISADAGEADFLDERSSPKVSKAFLFFLSKYL